MSCGNLSLLFQNLSSYNYEQSIGRLQQNAQHRFSGINDLKATKDSHVTPLVLTALFSKIILLEMVLSQMLYSIQFYYYRY